MPYKGKGDGLARVAALVGALEEVRAATVNELLRAEPGNTRKPQRNRIGTNFVAATSVMWARTVTPDSQIWNFTVPATITLFTTEPTMVTATSKGKGGQQSAHTKSLDSLLTGRIGARDNSQLPRDTHPAGRAHEDFRGEGARLIDSRARAHSGHRKKQG